MGSCFSSHQYHCSDADCSGSSRRSRGGATAKVISSNGNLQEYATPIPASQVLQSEAGSSSSSFFLCDSDKLYFDECITPMDPSELLHPDQIYFVLPVARLQFPLTISDMAALAVKATAALLECSNRTARGGGRRQRGKSRVLPHVNAIAPFAGDGEFDGVGKVGKDKSSSNRSIKGLGLPTYKSVRKLPRSSTASRRTKIMYRSFKERLSTIHEGEELVVAH